MKRNPYRKIKIEKQKKLMPDYNGCVFACGNKKIPQSTIMANRSGLIFAGIVVVLTIIVVVLANTWAMKK